MELVFKIVFLTPFILLGFYGWLLLLCIFLDMLTASRFGISHKLLGLLCK